MVNAVAEQRLGSHAIVIGASMSGLTAAGVLASYFDRVTILDRDSLPDEPEFRRGAPQSRHVHLLLPRGWQALELIFPGFKQELIDHDAQSIRWPQDVLWLTAAGWSERFAYVGPETFSMSRELIEWLVRRRVMALERVSIRDSRNVTGLLHDSSRNRVSGVRHIARGAGPDEPSAEEELVADLVVDASGRNSRSPRWFEELGYEAPQETQVNAFVGYSTRRYRRPHDDSRDWKGQFLQPAPPDDVRGAVMWPIEGNQWIVTLMGAGDERPPTDEDGFLEFARSLRTQTLFEAIKDAEPITPVFGYRTTDNRFRHYHELAQFPEQFIAIGDGLCAFNPIYGQGMSVAALEAAKLQQALLKSLHANDSIDRPGLARRVQRRIARVTADPWLLATSSDLRYPDTEGAAVDFPTRLTHLYLDRLISGATTDVKLNRSLSRVLGLLEPSRSLFHPRTMRRTLTAQATGRPLDDPPASQHNLASVDRIG